MVLLSHPSSAGSGHRPPRRPKLAGYGFFRPDLSGLRMTIGPIATGECREAEPLCQGSGGVPQDIISPLSWKERGPGGEVDRVCFDRLPRLM